MDSPSQKDVLLYRPVLAEEQTQDASQVFDDSLSASPITKRRHTEHEGSSADHAVTPMSTRGNLKERRLNRSRLRSWRISEAFTVRMNLIFILEFRLR